MSTEDKINYKYISHKIHYFKKSPRGDYALEELDPLPEEVDTLPEEVKEPSHKNIINESNKENENMNNLNIESNKSNSNNPANETTNSTNNKNIVNDKVKNKVKIYKKNKSNLGSITKGIYKIIIGIAMYAEEYSLINSTLEGISRSLASLAEAGISQERILILIISDGSGKVNKEVYETFTQKKLEPKEAKEAEIENFMKSEIFSDIAYAGQKTNYLTSCLIKREKIKAFENNKETYKSEMDILFSIKKDNRGKLDSHHWLFAGFCKQINPKFVILLDAGTVPDLEFGKALSSLILPMKNDPNIAGTCGEMELSNESNCSNTTLCAQLIEYKYAHVVDKNFESLFGFISVLPGAFSAYRWSALNNSKTLSEYFKTIGNEKADCAMANRYLAEDRIFCWVLFAMSDQANILRFIPDAKAKTDAPDMFGEFMLQRRRWINGSNFAMFYVLGKYSEICGTKHCVRQLFFLFLYIYYVVQAALSYCTIGTYYFVYYMICEKNFKKDSAAASMIMSTYLFIIIFTIIGSLTMKPIRVVSTNINTKQEEVEFKQRTIYIIMSIILGLYNLFAFILGVYTIFNGGMNNPDKAKFQTANEYYQAYKQYWGALALAAIGLSNFLLPLIYHPSMICLWFNNFFQYLLFQPTYAIILNIFSVCNIDDVSWGNRDSIAHMSDNTFKKYKLKYLAGWLVVNFIIGWGFSYIVTNPESISNGNDKKLINFYSILVAVLSAVKLIGAMLGKFKYYIIDKRWRKIMQNNDVNGNSTSSRNLNNDENREYVNAHYTEEAGLQQNKASVVNINVDIIEEENKNYSNFKDNNDLKFNDIEKGINREKNNLEINNNSKFIDINDIDLKNKLGAVEECKILNNDENKKGKYCNDNDNYQDFDENKSYKIKVAYENRSLYDSDKKLSSSFQ